MASATVDVHFGLSHCSVALSSFEKCQAVLFVLDDVLSQPFDIDTLHFVLSDLEWIALLGVLEEVE